MQKKNCIVILLLMALFVYLEYPIKEYAIVHGSVSAWVVATFSADSKYQMFIFFGLYYGYRTFKSVSWSFTIIEMGYWFKPFQ